MGQQVPYRAGNLFGFYYAFAKRGEGIPMHSHDETTQHNVIVLRGSVVVYGERGPDASWRQVLGTGDVLDIDQPIQHEIVALEDDTIILNLMLNGMPAEYAGLPESEFSGTTSPPTFPLKDIP